MKTQQHPTYKIPQLKVCIVASPQVTRKLKEKEKRRVEDCRARCNNYKINMQLKLKKKKWSKETA